MTGGCIIDGLRVKRVGEKTFEIVQAFVDDIVTLPDEQIFEAVVWTMAHCKPVVEGAAGHRATVKASGARSRAGPAGGGFRGGVQQR